ncbi:hypothetical protein AB0E96_02820 [Kitasatospora sp. NPDC036755]|uniref:hypothetical protein n=1 Tax=Kitasatospora sp. NPDC036755 TaxID=3154600 RepID=UPI0033FDD786
MNLTTLARHTLSRGATPAATYALIARLGHPPLPVARAVCLALDIPLAETTRRLADCYDALLADPRPGSECDTGEVLEALGVFDVPKSLTDAELAIVDLFLTAMDAMGGIRPGHRHGLQRWFTTGNLTTAGELLTTTLPSDRRIRHALTHCRTQTTRHQKSTPPTSHAS